jgi:hypothetical protein
MAGVIYKKWEGDVCAGTTHLADTAIQAYNYRLCLSAVDNNSVKVNKPEGYNRNEFLSLIDDIKAGVVKDFISSDEVQGLFNTTILPNGKLDANSQSALMISSDLPQENWPYPKAGWKWRESFEKRLRNYTLALMYFVQQDTAVPAWFRAKAARYGLAKDEYEDNDNFPRQMYVREARRISGYHLFTAHDAIPNSNTQRPTLHPNAVASAHHHLQSHAMRKREPTRCHLDGVISYETSPFTIPLGTIVPVDVDNLLCPVAVSATHAGYCALRKEPCRMALGEAAGEAAALCVEQKKSVHKLDVGVIQTRLLKHGAVLMYFKDISYKTHPDAFAAVQYFGLKGFETDWYFRPDDIVSDEVAENWHYLAGFDELHTAYKPGSTTRAQLLSILYNHLNNR